MRKIIYVFFGVMLLTSCSSKGEFHYVGNSHNDLITLLEKEGYTMKSYTSVDDLLEKVPSSSPVLVLSSHYPEGLNEITTSQLNTIRSKKLRAYIEYASIEGSALLENRQAMELERVVVTDSVFNQSLSPMTLLTINGNYVLPIDERESILVMAKVAGFDKAEYGLVNTKVLPLLYYYDENIIVATSQLSNFASSRLAPESKWKMIWETILSQLSSKEIKMDSWFSYVTPSYTQTAVLPSDARKASVEKGIEWFYNGHFLIHESWKVDWVDKYMGDGAMPIGPELPRDIVDGDGSLGVLEGHCSFIYHDGTQKYRYWLRNDVQGESAMAFSLAGKLLKQDSLLQVAHNVNNYSFDKFRQGPRNDPKSPTYGLLSWSATNEGVYYGDDNARSVLGSLAAAAILEDGQWNQKILECIVANFKTTGENGFRGERLEEVDIQKNGLKYYINGNKVNPHPHFESWLWACYLWLYNKTNYEPFLDYAKRGIKLTMEAYPQQWGWTNGIQQERARMLLPLAWLVRVEPSKEHKKWLDFMVDELLNNQVECGAIREELGDASTGMFGKTDSNEAYGLHEAPLIFNNGDPIADMLYTNNFAFIGLHEAAKASGSPKHIAAVESMSNFLIRIQVHSEHFKNVDGAWFRAFNYHNWDYWASNADAGWGAWSTLTGWIQSWIVSTQALLELDTSLWELTNELSVDKEWKVVKQEQLQ